MPEPDPPLRPSSAARPRSSGNLVLIGPRGCGKTTLGRALSLRCQRPFLDLDQALALDAGEDCDALLRREGEAAFRVREQAVLREAALLSGHVLATGGGAVLCGEAFEALAAPATVVYLSMPLEILIDRAVSRPRPALTELPLHEEVAGLLAQREPLYRAAADRTIPGDAVDPILAVLNFWPERPSQESP